MKLTIEERDSPHEVTETEKESVLKNIGTLAETPYGTAPFLRDAGVHLPENLTEYSRNRYATEIINNAETYEDRAEVYEVKVDENGNTKVVIEFGNE